MSGRTDSSDSRTLHGGSTDWPQLVERAAEELLRQLSACGELLPRQVAETVAATLPADVAG